MSRYIARIACGVAVVMAISWRASAQQTITITFTKGTGGAACLASISPATDKAKKVKRKEPVKWVLQNSTVPRDMCNGFNPKFVCLDFDTDALESGRLPCSTGGDITDKATASATDAPNNSRHPYIIRYKGRNAGDPEIDINGDFPPPPVPPNR
jgi:hypothetical protein